MKRALHWLRDFSIGPASGWPRALVVLYLAIEAIRHFHYFGASLLATRSDDAHPVTRGVHDRVSA